ncbi:Hypothetical_protein [Hexamita inflata]|uniref:Hypothetical_protein n=1 Tax=Hexamita inflata TaxID=28002 RepID=A0AA86TY77_9EUKA|nr:Hypothetical protein HINF_LOCUS20536 [Hexamita inflata]CAI9934565.1 Hypothetical protein HINF_LOCUS22210 [Hexamita inflata]
MKHSVKKEPRRVKTTIDQRNQIKLNFLQQFNECYAENALSVEEAVMRFKNLSRSEKRIFNWLALDESIGKSSYKSKSFSYKYINEVVALEFAQETVNITDLQPLAYNLIQQQLADIQALKSNEQFTFIQKQIVQDTLFYTFNIQTREENYYQRKRIVDALNYFVQKQMQTINSSFINNKMNIVAKKDTKRQYIKQESVKDIVVKNESITDKTQTQPEQEDLYFYNLEEDVSCMFEQ